MKKLLPLTGIRAIAAFWVVLLHLQYLFNYGPFNPIAQKGYLGVDLFFLLSGFIISYVHQHEFSQPTLRASLHFWILRVARIFPVHYLMLFILLIKEGLSKSTFWPFLDPRSSMGAQFFYHLLNIQAWGVARYNAWNIPAWSVSAEWFAYLLFPLTTPWVSRLTNLKSNLFFIAGCFAILTGFSAWMGLQDIDWTYRYSLLRVELEFLTGCALYNLFKHPSTARISGPILIHLSLSLLTLGLFLKLPDIVSVFLLGTFLFGLARGKGWLCRFLSRPVLVYLGEISFSVYMVHNMVAGMFNSIEFRWHLIRYLPSYQRLFLFIAVFSVILGLAQLVYKFVEVPARQFIRRALANRLGYSPEPRPTISETV